MPQPRWERWSSGRVLAALVWCLVTTGAGLWALWLGFWSVVTLFGERPAPSEYAAGAWWTLLGGVLLALGPAAVNVLRRRTGWLLAAVALAAWAAGVATCLALHATVLR